MSILIDIHELYLFMNIYKDTASEVYHLGFDDILKELHTQADIDKGTKDHVDGL